MAAVSVKIYDMFWSEMVSGLGELGGKPLPRIPSSTSPPPPWGPSSRKELGRKTLSLIFSEGRGERLHISLSPIFSERGKGAGGCMYTGYKYCRVKI